MVYFLPPMLKDRKPMRAKLPVFLWNALLATFSIMGVLKHSIVVFREAREAGLQNYICQENIPDSFHWNTKAGAFGFYMHIFVLSKVAELFDTAILIFKKADLKTLHVWHHFSVLLYCVHGAVLTNQVGSGAIFGAMNFCVHAVMYSYYALATIGIKSPAAIVITLLQILQMFAGCYISYTVGDCAKHHSRDRMFALIMYASYNFLFCRFFYYRYIAKKPKKDKAKQK